MHRRRFLQGLGATALGLTALRMPVLARDTGTTGLVYSDTFLEHVISPAHPESPRRLQAVMEQLRSRDWFDDLVAIDPYDEPGPALHRVHTDEHIDSIRRRYETSHRVALQAAGGVVAAIDAVMDGRVRNVFCASRPPGHHARNTGREEGFCYYNSIAIGARYLQDRYGLERILIVDWDYHHGDGTQETFYDDPGVLFFSTHDNDAYPAKGYERLTGSGAGEGYNINVHLPCQTTDADIVAAFEDRLLPAAVSYDPQFVLISAGFDSRQSDLLGCYDVTDAGFRKLTQMVMAIADQHCDGRVVSMLEGGYNLRGLASATATHVETLLRG